MSKLTNDTMIFLGWVYSEHLSFNTLHNPKSEQNDIIVEFLRKQVEFLDRKVGSDNFQFVANHKVIDLALVEINDNIAYRSLQGGLDSLYIKQFLTILRNKMNGVYRQMADDFQSQGKASMSDYVSSDDVVKAFRHGGIDCQCNDDLTSIYLMYNGHEHQMTEEEIKDVFENSSLASFLFCYFLNESSKKDAINAK